MPNVSVKKGDPPETKEILAEAIVRISDALVALQASGVNERAIIILVQADTGLAQHVIRSVFSALRQLKARYCR